MGFDHVTNQIHPKMVSYLLNKEQLKGCTPLQKDFRQKSQSKKESENCEQCMLRHVCLAKAIQRKHLHWVFFIKVIICNIRVTAY